MNESTTQQTFGEVNICDHIGQWEGNGIVVDKESLSEVCSSIFCKRCGYVKIVRD